MSQEEILYIKIDQNILVHDYHVTLGDIAKLESSDKSMVRQLKQKKIYSFEKPKGNLKNKKQIQVISIMKVIAWIHEEYPNVDIQNMGEPDFVLEYEPKKEENKVWDYLHAADELLYQVKKVSRNSIRLGHLGDVERFANHD